MNYLYLFFLTCSTCILGHCSTGKSTRSSSTPFLSMQGILLCYNISTLFYQDLVVYQSMKLFSHHVPHSLDHSVDLVVEAFLWKVRSHCNMRMSYPCFKSSFVQMSGQLETFSSCRIISSCVMLFGSICS